MVEFYRSKSTAKMEFSRWTIQIKLTIPRFAVGPSPTRPPARMKTKHVNVRLGTPAQVCAGWSRFVTAPSFAIAGSSCGNHGATPGLFRGTQRAAGITERLAAFDANNNN